MRVIISSRWIFPIFVSFLFINSNSFTYSNNRLLNRTLYVGGDGPGNYSSIQDAINDAMPGDTIFVYDDSSPYYENVVIYKPIMLKGENKSTTMIIGNGKLHAIEVFADNVVITGFTVKNRKKFSSIYIEANNTIIKNNILINSSYGIIINSCNSNYIERNTFTLNRWVGIHLYLSYNNLILNNFIFQNKCDGIDLDSSDKNIIKNNSIVSNQIGIEIYKSNDNIIINNKIYRNIGIEAFIGSGICILDSVNNSIIENNVSNNECGISLVKTNDTKIENNTISNQEAGITLSSSLNNSIMNNVILNNTNGLLIYRSTKNLIMYNKFLNNKRQAYFVNSFLNRWDRNYWDNWIGIGPKIIFGKIFTIPWVNFDWHPIKNQSFCNICPFQHADLISKEILHNFCLESEEYRIE